MARLQRLFIALFFLISSPCWAAHLIGGYLSYSCSGGNDYDIRLRVYRDCGGGGASFDNVARLAIYDVNNNLVRTLSANLGAITQVSTAITGNPCAVAPPTVCSEYTDYVFSTVNLPPLAGGYTLVHQRCCRNSTISNVDNSGSYGNTYSIVIPSLDTTCNSSPVINGVPPTVVCQGVPSIINIPASDPDGDSLYFEFCDILTGGGSGGTGCLSVIPNPPCPPPFTPVPFSTGFSAANPLPGNPGFSLDPVTGTLTGQANQSGQYVVGICISEFRAGQLLTTVRFDYQFNFTNCISTVVSDVVSQIEDPTIGCDGLEIQFRNQSTGATSYFWDFGDTTTLADTSRLREPAYTYPGPGRYWVTLIAEPGLSCADTIRLVFEIKPPVNPAFNIHGERCFEGQDMDFLPYGFYPTGTVFSWDFGNGATPPASFRQFPEGVRWDSPGKHYITLSITTPGGCSYSVRDSVQVDALTVDADAGNDTTVVRGDIVRLRGMGGEVYRWAASEAVRFSNMNSAKTTVELVNGDTISFYLLVTDYRGCQGRDTVMVFVTEGDTRQVPNLFTPNGDQLNEFFDLSLANPAGECELTVFNRWGKEVFYRSRYQNDWTGLNQSGAPLPEGTYYYILRCDKEIVLKDAITIMYNN